jgi:hypothetical protein
MEYPPEKQPRKRLKLTPSFFPDLLLLKNGKMVNTNHIK